MNELNNELNNECSWKYPQMFSELLKAALSTRYAVVRLYQYRANIKLI